MSLVSLLFCVYTQSAAPSEQCARRREAVLAFALLVMVALVLLFSEWQALPSSSFALVAVLFCLFAPDLFILFYLLGRSTTCVVGQDLALMPLVHFG
jgi:hypothetical protein